MGYIYLKSENKDEFPDCRTHINAARAAQPLEADPIGKNAEWRAELRRLATSAVNRRLIGV